MRLLIASVLTCIASPLAAATVAYPVSIPPDCMELAEREHVPVMIENRYQALKAEYKLARLNKADPLVAQCKQAVARLKAQSKS